MGFRRGFSASDAISELVISLNKTMNHGKYLVCLFLDLKKAFHCVNHSSFCESLCESFRKMGFNPLLVKWIKSFLTDRVQTVKVN